MKPGQRLRFWIIAVVAIAWITLTSTVDLSDPGSAIIWTIAMLALAAAIHRYVLKNTDETGRSELERSGFFQRMFHRDK